MYDVASSAETTAHTQRRKCCITTGCDDIPDVLEDTFHSIKVVIMANFNFFHSVWLLYLA